MTAVLRIAGALAAGLVFGLGLIVSQMVNPQKVLAFLDIAGAWDPSLALVMGAALAVTLPGYRLVLGRSRPLGDDAFHLPTATAIDARLVAGSVLFGVGWGLAGLCPGPAIVAVMYQPQSLAVFVGTMVLAAALYRIARPR